MSWYSNYKNEWKEIIETVAREEKRSNIIVEKDLIQSLFLYELSKFDLPFVFKGGTSLSKAYGLIDRFSEDIDLSMNKRPTDSEKRKSNEIIMNIANQLGLKLSNPDMIKTRYNYNKYVFKYESLFSATELEIIIETSYYQSVYPISKHVINSYIGSFCKNNNITLPIPFVLDFEINVQSIERTFNIIFDRDYSIQDFSLVFSVNKKVLKTILKKYLGMKNNQCFPVNFVVPKSFVKEFVLKVIPLNEPFYPPIAFESDNNLANFENYVNAKGRFLGGWFYVGHHEIKEFNLKFKKDEWSKQFEQTYNDFEKAGY